MLSVWPQEPCNECHMPIFSDHVAGCRVKGNIDNARERGIETDSLFSRYVVGTLDRIPAGTRVEIYNPEPPFDGLLQKLMKWWDGLGLKAQAQVILSDTVSAGTCDIFIDDGRIIADLKTVYDLSTTYEIQLGFYALLARVSHGVIPQELWLIHATKRYAAPRIAKVDVHGAMGDASIVRQMYSMIKRRTGKG